MDHAIASRTPTHLWAVGVLSLLWNCFGAYNYSMSRLGNREFLAKSGDPDAILAYIDGMPLYASIGWGLGVWGALLGSVLLLTRSRYAVHAFALSLAGAVVSFTAQYLGPPMPGDTGAGKYIPLVIITLAAAQLWYAMRESKAGVLR